MILLHATLLTAAASASSRIDTNTVYSTYCCYRYYGMFAAQTSNDPDNASQTPTSISSFGKMHMELSRLLPTVKQTSTKMDAVATCSFSCGTENRVSVQCSSSAQEPLIHAHKPAANQCSVTASCSSSLSPIKTTSMMPPGPSTGLCPPLTPTARRRSRQIEYDLVVTDLKSNGSISSKDDSAAPTERSSRKSSKCSVNGSIKTADAIARAAKLRSSSLTSEATKSVAQQKFSVNSLVPPAIPERVLPPQFGVPPKIKHPLSESVVQAALKACSLYLVGFCVSSLLLTLSLVTFLFLFPLRCFAYFVTHWTCQGMFHWLHRTRCDPFWPLTENLVANTTGSSDKRQQSSRVESPFVSFCVVTIQGTLDVSDVRSLFWKKVLHTTDSNGCLKYVQFTQKPHVGVCGHYSWTDDQCFDIQNHVFSCSSGSGGMTENGTVDMPAISSLRDLEEYINRLWGMAFPAQRPAWDVQLIQEFGESKCTLLLLRCHSRLTDVLCLPKLLTLVNDTNVCIGVDPKLNFSIVPLAWSIWQALLLGPLELLTRCIPKPSLLMPSRLWDYVQEPILRRDVLTWARVPNLDHLLRIERLLHCSIAELFLSFIAGAFQQHFKAKGILHPPDMEVCIPIALFGKPNAARSLAASSSVGSLNYCECGNTLVPFLLPVSVEGCVPRIWEVQRRLSDIMEGPIPFGFWLCSNLATALAPSSWTKRLFRRAHSNCSCAISFYRASAFADLNLRRHRIHSILNYSALASSIRCSFSFMHIGREIVLSLAVDQSIFPDPDILLIRFQSEIQHLLKQVSGRLLSPLSATLFPVAIASPLMAAKTVYACSSATVDETTPLASGVLAAHHQSTAAGANSSGVNSPPPLVEIPNDSSLEDLETLLQTVQTELATMKQNPSGSREKYFLKLSQFEQKMEALQRVIANKLHAHRNPLGHGRALSTPENIGGTAEQLRYSHSVSGAGCNRLRRKRSRRTSSPTAIRTKYLGVVP